MTRFTLTQHRHVRPSSTTLGEFDGIEAAVAAGRAVAGNRGTAELGRCTRYGDAVVWAANASDGDLYAYYTVTDADLASRLN